HVLLSDVTLRYDQAVGTIAAGGGIANVFGASLVVSHSTFTDNRATGATAGDAGAVLNDGGSALVVDHSTFTRNQATTSLGAGAGIQGISGGGAISSVGGSQATVSH